MTSTESEFMLAFQNQTDGSSATTPTTPHPPLSRPNYYIPKACIALNEVLGEGEFGSVYKGSMKCEMSQGGFVATEVPVAIKTLHDEHCKENRAEFLREASVMIKLSHHCIVTLIGISKVSFREQMGK